VTARFDTDEAELDLETYVSIRGVAGNMDSGTDPNYLTPLVVSSGQKLFTANAPLLLGGQFLTDYSDRIVDEFSICDFGDFAPTAADASALWTKVRFSDGRYYKGGDAAFLSRIQRPVGGPTALLLHVRWTAVLPCEPRLEFQSGGETDYPTRAPDPWLGINPVSGLPRLRLEVDLLPEDGDFRSPALVRLTQGEPLVNGPASFRYRVRFAQDLADPLNDPILESAFFDDITFAWRLRSGPRILTWEAVP
jgi:hypothetical protein